MTKFQIIKNILVFLKYSSNASFLVSLIYCSVIGTVTYLITRCNTIGLTRPINDTKFVIPPIAKPIQMS